MDYEDTDLLKGKFSKYLSKSSATNKSVRTIFVICIVIVKILIGMCIAIARLFPREKFSIFVSTILSFRRQVYTRISIIPDFFSQVACHNCVIEGCCLFKSLYSCSFETP